MIPKNHFLNIILKINYKRTTLLRHHHHQKFILPLPCHHHLLLRPASLLKFPLNHPCSQRRRDKQFQQLSQTIWLVFLVTPTHVTFIFIIISSPPWTTASNFAPSIMAYQTYLALLAWILENNALISS